VDVGFARTKVAVIYWDVESGEPIKHMTYGIGEDVQLIGPLLPAKGSAILVRIREERAEDSNDEEELRYVEREEISQLLLVSKEGSLIRNLLTDRDVAVAATPEGITILKNERFFVQWDRPGEPVLNGRIHTADVPERIAGIARVGKNLTV